MNSNNLSKRLIAAVVIVGLAVATYLLRPATENSAIDAEPAATEVALPRLLDLGADKCVPCKMMAPILEEMKVEFAAVMTVDFVDVWKDPAAAAPYGIKLIPTQIFFSADGTELFRHEGFYGREEILTKWRELGVDLPEKGV